MVHAVAVAASHCAPSSDAFVCADAVHTAGHCSYRGTDTAPGRPADAGSTPYAYAAHHLQTGDTRDRRSADSAGYLRPAKTDAHRDRSDDGGIDGGAAGLYSGFSRL